MGIWSRLGRVINNYLNDFEADNYSGGSAARGAGGGGDPDLDAAYEELNDFLNRKEARSGGNGAFASAKLPPEELRTDFEYLGVPFGADAGTCKAAYKKLLKIHHPDRHAGHEGNYKKATEKSAKINAAYDRIEKWRNS
jgi:DnaJ-domain-containing protein 1